MNAKKNLYESLIEQFKGHIPSVKTFRLFNNQFDQEELEDAFSYPAVFMEFESIDYRPTTSNSENIDFVLNFHIGFASLKTEDLEVLTIMEDIYTKLQGFNGLIRISETQDTAADNVAVWIQTYRVTLVDDTANIGQTGKKVIIPVLQVDTDLVIDTNSTSGVRSDDKLT